MVSDTVMDAVMFVFSMSQERYVRNVLDIR
jgi:hypothetical protein